MTNPEPLSQIGSARIEPSGQVVAGEFGSWHLVITAGQNTIQPGGGFLIDTDTDTDWGLPQLDDPAGDDFMSVVAPDGVGVVASVINNSRQRFKLFGRALNEGESITVVFGDQSEGSRGSRAQTFLEARRVFRVSVDPDGSGRWLSLSDSPVVEVVGGKAAKLVIQVPSGAQVGQPFAALIRAEDAWGNPATFYRGTVAVSADRLAGGSKSVAFDESDRGVVRVDGMTMETPGTVRFEVADQEHKLSAVSNPLIASQDAPAFALHWGDLHGGQVADASKIEDFFRFARDIAGIQFVSYQRNDHSMSPDDYRLQQRLEREFYEPGSFVPVPGFEWSAGTSLGGHHNVFFRRFDQPARRSSHREIDDKSEQHLDLPHIKDVFNAYRGSDTTITPHVGGLEADLSFHDPLLEPALEVTSDHGSFAWFLEQSLRAGYEMGFLGGSDSHNGRPGYDHPGFQLRRYAKSGLTGLYLNELTVEGVLEALHARRCFATTGARMIGWIEVDGHRMGSKYQTSGSPVVNGSITATAPLEEISLFRGVTEIYRHRIDLERRSDLVRVTWDGASRESSYSGLIWSGQVQFSNPVLRSVDTIRFDSPRSHVFSFSPSGLAWNSWTCGYRSGVVLELERNSDFVVTAQNSGLARVRFGGRGSYEQRIANSPGEQVRFRADSADLISSPVEIELGEVDRRLVVEAAPISTTLETSFNFTDDHPEPGVNPYWIRARQVDGEVLWTSPVFVDYLGK